MALSDSHEMLGNLSTDIWDLVHYLWQMYTNVIHDRVILRAERLQFCSNNIGLLCVIRHNSRWPSSELRAHFLVLLHGFQNWDLPLCKPIKMMQCFDLDNRWCQRMEREPSLHRIIGFSVCYYMEDHLIGVQRVANKRRCNHRGG